MKHVKLRTLDVGRICLGAMGMSAAYSGAGSGDAESIRTIHRAIDLGVTLVIPSGWAVPAAPLLCVCFSGPQVPKRVG